MLGGQFAFGIDIAAVDPHRRGANKPGPFGRGLVGDSGGPDLRVDPQLSRDPLDQRQRRWEVRTMLDIQHLDHQARRSAVLT
jgi:hypothetical protein